MPPGPWVRLEGAGNPLTNGYYYLISGTHGSTDAVYENNIGSIYLEFGAYWNFESYSEGGLLVRYVGQNKDASTTPPNPWSCEFYWCTDLDFDPPPSVSHS